MANEVPKAFGMKNPDGANGGDKPERGGGIGDRFVLGLFIAAAAFLDAIEGYLAKDHGDHLERGAAAKTRGEEQPHKHHVKCEETPGTGAGQGEEQQAGKQRHQNEVHRGDVDAAQTVGNDAAEGSRQGADKRAKEGQLQDIHLRKLRFGQHREAGGKPMNEPKVAR